MSSRGLDYSAGVISGAAIAQAGYGFVVRYIEDPDTRLGALRRKHIRPGEYADLTAHGVDVWLVFEVNTSDALGGYDQGVAYARRARAGADWISYPPGRMIFFAADMHLTPAEITVALAYLDGAASVLGRAAVGAYGFVELITAAAAGGHAAAFWQCGHAPGPGAAHLWQRNDGATAVAGIQCDINELIAPLPGSAAPPAPAGDPAGLPSLVLGQNGPAVASLQRFLNAYDWRPALPLLPAIGYYGPMTAGVLRSAQIQMGVQGGDGRNVGPQTKTALWARGWRG